MASGAVDPRAVRAAEQQAADKKAKAIYTGVAVLFVVATVFMLVFNSGMLQRSKTAVTVDGTDYSVAETAFYYSNAFQTTVQNMGGTTYAAYFGLDTTKPLKDQTASSTYTGAESDMTWDEYFKDQAVNSLKYIQGVLAKAKAENMTMEAEDNASLESSIQGMKDQAAAGGYSYKAYLTAVFGQGMTPSLYEKLMADNILANKYVTAYTENLTYTDDEIQAYYEENKNSYDLVDGGYIIVDGKPEEKTDKDGNAVSPTHEEIEASMAAAEKIANDILADYKKGSTDLKALAEKYEAYSNYVSEEISFTPGITGDWFFDENRKDGDTAILEDMIDYRYYIAVFNSRSRDITPTYDVRHILVDSTSVDAKDGEEVTTDMVAARAQEILDSWDGTEAGFAALAEQHSTDEGSKTNGGLYEDVSKGEMVATFNSWCYEDGRQPGDTGIVASSYGQHIMYFVGYGDTEHWYNSCKSAMASAATAEWQDELMASLTAEVQPGMDSVGN